MSFEIESKFRISDPQALHQRLIDLEAEPGPSLDHEDYYLAHPARDFAQSNEAFRIRRVGDTNVLTYKGPKQPGPTKTREEIEIPFAPGPIPLDQMTALLDRLGFRPVAVVRKSRKSYHLNHLGRTIEVALDTSPTLGAFAEIEVLANSPEDIPSAQAAVLDLAQRLRLTEVEPRSYLRMTLDSH